jgi:ferredoxin
MPYVIAEPCIGVKDKSCIAVCPVDCIQEGTIEKDGVVLDQLFIDPEECIDCGLCEPECPVDAIFMADEVPDQWKNFIQINADFYKPETRKK